jgi:hypothetical protein
MDNDTLVQNSIAHTERGTTVQVRRVTDTNGRSLVFIDDIYDGNVRKSIALDDHVATFVRDAIDFVAKRY